MNLRKRVTETFVERFGRAPEVVVKAPGRVNLLGAHSDYNEGLVLPAAIDRAAWVAAARNNSDVVRVWALDFAQEGTFALDEVAALRGVAVEPTWLRYPMGMAWAVQEAGELPFGMDVVLTSDVPVGAGVSSSAAVEMAFLLAWEQIAGFTLPNLTRAQLGQRAENEYLNVGSGMMDQFASVAGRANHLVLLDCRTLDHELVPLPEKTAVLLVDSGVRRQLVVVDYNSRPEQCREAVALLQPHLPGIQSLRDVSWADFENYSHHLPMVLRRRVRHAIGERERVLAGAAALRQGKVAAFGQLIKASQLSSRDNYEVSIPELDLLAAVAWRQPGCYGSRFGGGGFGGFMQVLVDLTAVDPVAQAMSAEFETAFGRTPRTFVCQIADGASVVSGNR